MPDHPFTYPYIGLGVLDEASIVLDRNTWRARYVDTAGILYAEVQVSEIDGHVQVTGYHADGMRGGIGTGRDLREAVLYFALGEISSDGRPAPIAKRLAAMNPRVFVFLDLEDPDTKLAVAPGVALYQVLVPRPIDAPLPPIEPGPLSRLAGYGAEEDEDSPFPGVLVRTFAVDGEEGTVHHPILIHSFTRPPLVIPELGPAIWALAPNQECMEWRPWLEQPGRKAFARMWPAPMQTVRGDGLTLRSYSVAWSRCFPNRPQPGEVAEPELDAAIDAEWQEFLKDVPSDPLADEIRQCPACTTGARCLRHVDPSTLSGEEFEEWLDVLEEEVGFPPEDEG
jgi:hypothetical protein